MAMAKLSNTVVDINGKLGGNIYRTDVCGQHIQSFPRLVHRETPKQRSRRGAFSRLWHYWWKQYLTQKMRDKWWIYSATHPITNKKGEVGHLSAFNWFVKINIVRVINGLTPLPVPPKD